jgi:DNA-binding NarL/FixJ family response regulator
MTETASSSDRARVILADPDPIARAAVRAGFDKAPGFVVTAETGDGQEAAELSAHYRPELAVLATELRALDTTSTSRRIIEQAPGVGILILAPRPDSSSELAALRAGASGLVAKTSGVEEILAAARTVCDGELAVSAAVTRLLVERLRMLPEAGVGMRPVRSALTSREWEVLDLLTVGHTTPVIAAELYLTANTVNSHIKSILRKLRVHSRAEAVQRGAELRRGLPSAA